jgi:hypothetical protein
MQSDQGLRIPEDMDPDMPEMYGRTGWDAAYSLRFWLLGALVVGSIIAAVYLCMTNGVFDGISFGDILNEYWPALVSPFFGMAMGWYAIKKLYIVGGRYLLQTDLKHGTVRLMFVPEARFRTMKQAGNTFVLNTLGGTPVYLIRDVDFESGYIDYGWVHEERAEVVAVDLDAYNRWRDDLTDTKVENLQLIANPQVIAAGLSRKNLKDHLDRLCAALGISSSPQQENPLDEDPEDDGLTPSKRLKKQTESIVQMAKEIEEIRQMQEGMA